MGSPLRNALTVCALSAFALVLFLTGSTLVMLSGAAADPPLALEPAGATPLDTPEIFTVTASPTARDATATSTSAASPQPSTALPTRAPAITVITAIATVGPAAAPTQPLPVVRYITATPFVRTATPRPATAAAPPSPTPVVAPSARLSAASTGPAPTRLSINSIGVNAAVVTAGIDANNTMQAPPSGDVVAWYTFSAAPGNRGNVVISGHVDFGRATAVFWRLREIQAGDRVSVFGVGGEEFRYEVTDVASYQSTGPPLEQILGQTSFEALTLITCDGTFDTNVHAYDHRLIVRAVRT